jgi:pSer/pThr/pTyr-binding forkhead associated (FHA) protein
MPKMIVSIDGVVIKEVQLIKERTTLGRRPYNDIVIDNLAVSGEHAVLQLLGGNEVYLEDLNSTNGSYINGKAVKKQLLQNDDIVEIGKYRIKFIDDANFGYEKIIPTKSNGAAALSVDQLFTAPVEAPQQVPPVDNASIKVISGVATGREVALVKVVTTIGKPGIAIAAITKRTYGFVIAHVEGVSRPTINGVVLGDEAVTLSDGDVIELAGTKMQFLFT